jgi:hypothetical protein
MSIKPISPSGRLETRKNSSPSRRISVVFSLVRADQLRDEDGLAPHRPSLSGSRCGRLWQFRYVARRYPPIVNENLTAAFIRSGEERAATEVATIPSGRCFLAARRKQLPRDYRGRNVNQVRKRLAAGGRRIRTLGPACLARRDPQPISSESPEKTKRPTNPAKLKNMNRYDAWAGETPSSMTNSVGAQRMTP